MTTLENRHAEWKSCIVAWCGFAAGLQQYSTGLQFPRPPTLATDGLIACATSKCQPQRVRIDELGAAETNYRMAKARFRESTTIALEVLDAQQVTAKTRLNLSRHVVDFNFAQAHLLAATGLIDVEEFR